MHESSVLATKVRDAAPEPVSARRGLGGFSRLAYRGFKC